MATEREEQLLRDAFAAGIRRPQEIANFMAQVGHESGGFQQLQESFRYTRNVEQITGKVRSAMRDGREALEAARLDALAGRPESLAELMYGGRMGNDEPGDGYRYRGRGYIQLTGKNQYAAAGEALELDLVGQPDLAAQPGHAARIAIWYWQQNVPLEARHDARAAGAAINGRDPPNGLADREHRFEHWQRELSPERIRSLSADAADAAREEGAPVNFDNAMRVMLPPQAGVAPHITGYFGEARNGHAHGGTDFNYVGGQTGVNRQHPVVHSPVTGVVTFSGGEFGTVKIRDGRGHSHEILHLHSHTVATGQTVKPGDPIGTMGGRGPRGADQYAQHVHYQLRDPQGVLISPESFWNRAQLSTGERSEERTQQAPLRQTDRGAGVRALQETLAGLGFPDAADAPLRIDGVFGSRTAEAVRAFQQAHGLQVDGIVGSATREALGRAARDLPVGESPELSPIFRRPTPIDALLAAARDGDPATIKAALADFSETPFGRTFRTAFNGHAEEAVRSAETNAPVQGECGPRQTAP